MTTATRPKGFDVSDWFAAGGTPEELRRVIEQTRPFVPAAPKEEVAAESKLRFHSAKEVAAATASEPVFLAAPWVAEGAITEIDGKIKSAGKTTWTTHLCRAVLDGHDFMGQPTRQSPVVYLTEQSAATFREALRRADLLDRDDFHVLFWHDTIGTPWPDVVLAARGKAARVGARLLVVDTLGQFAGVRGDGENNAGVALEAVGPLQAASASDGLAVVILRHERKGGGEVGDSGRGSSAFAGAVDVVLRLRRAEGAPRPGVRVIDALSRFDQTPDTLVIELTDSGYVALGDTEAVATEEAREAVLAAAPTSEADAAREDALLEAAGVKRTIGQSAIREHLTTGRLRRTGEGKKGSPYRYWRPDGDETHSAAPPVAPAESNGHDPDKAELLSAATPTLLAAEGTVTAEPDYGEYQPWLLGEAGADRWTA